MADKPIMGVVVPDAIPHSDPYTGKPLEQLAVEVSNARRALAIHRAERAVVDAAIAWAASTGTEATLALRERVAELIAARKVKG